MKRQFLMVFAFLAVGLSAVAREASCPALSTYKLRYSYGQNSVISDFYLGVPLVRINLSWAQFSTSTTGDAVDNALKQLLTAIYADNGEVASRYVSQEAITSLGGKDGYAKAFHASLVNAGQLWLLGKVNTPKITEYVVKGAKQGTFRVFRFRAESGGHYVLDNNAPIEAAENLMLSGLRTGSEDQFSERSDKAEFKQIPMRADDPCPPVILVKIEPTPRLFQQGNNSSNPALRFYQQCRVQLGQGNTREYFACFGSQEAEKLNSAFEQLNITKKNQFIESQMKDMEPLFSLNGGTITVLMMSTKELGKRMLAHLNIVSVGTSFELVSPLTSGPLDDALNSPAVQDELLKDAAAMNIVN